MKKSLFTILLMSTVLFAGSANAQSKTAYINVEDLVSIMPETAKIDSQLQHYQSDSLAPYYTKIMAEYQAKMLLYNDSLKTTAAVHKQTEQELGTLVYQLQNWEQIQNQAIDSKRTSLLTPIYRKAYDAIKLVAKEKGYVHVFNKQVYLIAPDAEDMILAVATKLKITLPPGLRTGVKL